MPKPAEIVAALGDVSAIDSYATLQAEMVDLFTSMADCMKDWNDERSAQIMRKMAATVGTVPYQRAGTCVGGYMLTQGKEGPKSKERSNYTLARTTPEPAGPTPEPAPAAMAPEPTHCPNADETDTPNPDAAVGKCGRPSSDGPCSEAAHEEGFEVVGRAPAGSRCYLCGKSRQVYLIRLDGSREADQAHLACVKKGRGNPSAAPPQQR